MDMKILLKILLLGLTLVVVFISPVTIGLVAYYMMFPLLFFLVFLYYIVFYWVSDSDVQKVRKEEYTLSLFCGKMPSTGDGDLTRGRLVFTEDNVKLYQRLQKGRTKKTPAQEVWSLEVSEIRSLGVGKVLGLRKGLILYLDEGSVSFLSGKVIKQKEAIIKALGWDEVPLTPQAVEVSGDASEAPSFAEMDQKEQSRS
jgi:Ca2+/Na+ antiporter